MVLREEIAKAIYGTHWGVALESEHISPIWENASESVKSWVREQADSAIRKFDELCAPAGQKQRDER